MTIRPWLKGLQTGAMERVQLQHPGWRMPPHTRKVDRSTGRAPDGWGNLEASVRSRDTDGAERCGRDVIEAGLN
jgi:hypothetical protein